ncbi:MAG: N-acetylmuramoyl-L-alanine amidase [Ignavibacteriales bacterium]|nr:N-acetylmuramoyl-L-alanine amidase [Ignavibacteriales bacterium]
MLIQSKLHIVAVFTFIALCAVSQAQSKREPSPLAGKIIVIDPGHGGTASTDSYRQGPSGEREEWINLRVALILKGFLEEKGGTVLMTRTGDIAVPLAERAKLAVDNKADLFVSIHHNATADSLVNFPIIYFHGSASENQAGVSFAKHLAKSLAKHLFQSETPVSIVSDHAIFSEAGAGVLRRSYGIPGVIAEASFFTNPAEEQRLKQRQHNKNEATAYAEAIENFFSEPTPAILPKDTSTFPPQFQALQESDRMNPVALRWKRDFEEAKLLMEADDTTSIQKAYDLFTRSAKSFPDSYLAGKCHRYRALLLKKMGRLDEASNEEKRVREYYPE